MRNSLRIGSLCLTLTLTALAAPIHALPACPIANCNQGIGLCQSFGCGWGLIPQGQCVDSSGNVHNYFLLGCSCQGIRGYCYL
jgi:hypothetical protein